MRTLGYLLLSLLAGNCATPTWAAGRARHVVVLVWDGMRPDFITEQYTPTLWQLAREGVFFRNHHPVYISSTEVNGTAIATGAYPEHSHVMANIEYRPGIDWQAPIETQSLTAVRKGDELTHGHYLARPTVAEILQRAGRGTAIAGSKPVALLHDRAARTAASARGVTLFEGLTLPPNALADITRRLGAFPPIHITKADRDAWTTEALTGPLWDRAVPAFSLLWLAEPDYSQHATGPGSQQSLAGIRSCDENLGRVLRALTARGLRALTDVLIVSDHAFSTIARTIDLARALNAAGFNAQRRFTAAPAPGEILVVSNGGSSLLYVAGHDTKVVRDLVNFLQGQDYVGVLFTRHALPGTFALHAARIDTPMAPDIVVAFRWTPGKSTTGAPGTVISDNYLVPGQGMHVTLSRFDMHNTLVAAGPDFRAGINDPLPSGNVDLAPTILWILGVNPPKHMDGRVLSEALTIDGPRIRSFEPRRLTARCEHPGFVWQQYLNVTEVNGVVYLDEGNGSATPN
ncbi:MAG: alkaline phosphatase family protein [Verrucomicrobia bacterium]|nr:alkaline phosphatase family protein [Verrucomicrobiota bacterium]